MRFLLEERQLSIVNSHLTNSDLYSDKVELRCAPSGLSVPLPTVGLVVDRGRGFGERSGGSGATSNGRGLLQRLQVPVAVQVQATDCPVSVAVALPEPLSSTRFGLTTLPL